MPHPLRIHIRMRGPTKGQWINYGFMLSGILLAIWRALPTFSYTYYIISGVLKVPSSRGQRQQAAADSFYGLFREEAHVIIKSEDEYERCRHGNPAQPRAAKSNYISNKKSRLLEGQNRGHGIIKNPPRRPNLISMCDVMCKESAYKPHRYTHTRTHR